MERLLWNLLVGTRGGLTRGRIIELLAERPRNANELAGMLTMDYTTMRHHLRVLERNGLVSRTDDRSYAVEYALSSQFVRELPTFQGIWEIVKREMASSGRKEGERRG